MLDSALIVFAAAWHIFITRMARRMGLVKPNFCKSPILASYGLIAFPYVAVTGVILALHGYVSWNRTLLYLGVMAAMWALGAIDDIWGSREVGGFAGHFRKLLVEHKLTTGATKAIGGGIVALCAGYAIYSHNLLQAMLAAFVIALSANLLNLFDLRPGRAVAVLFCGLGVTYIVTCGHLNAAPLIEAIAVITFIFGIADSRGKAMMGDSGANSLGAALGLTIAISAPNWMLPTIVLITAVHIYSEKHSISCLIESNRILRVIDRFLGVR